MMHMKAKILVYVQLFCGGINDYPALGTMSGRTTRGYFACVHNDENPCSECLRNKIGFIGHRHFLPNGHS
jgi:hypothetical protein